METIKVLLFAANPQGTAPLDLAREFREIDEEVRMSPFRSAVELILVPGTRPVDLLRKLNENRPQVVHFSSHGDPDAIVLESDDPEAVVPGAAASSMRSTDERDMELVRPSGVETDSNSQGQLREVSKSALVNVLRACDEGNLRLVVLNACHTRSQAEALIEIVDCVVSMNRTITDRAAIKFAASFYGALAFGKSVQRAFDQGLARLSAEGLGETDTPELLVRAGVDASRVVLVGHTPPPIPKPAAEAPFLVPFPRNGDFVGRDGDLARLHASLSGSGAGPVGIRPAGLTGMGGIGKTQLAVEYVHRHREDYPDGIFWIDAAGPLAEGFARLATDPRLHWAEPERPLDEQIRAAFAALNDRPRALLVLDNLPDPAAIAVPLLPGLAPEDLRCGLLFTTRRHDLGRFAGVEVTVLPEEPALRLLLRHPSRRAALDPAHPDHDHARAIARMLGRLPLALELAGAYLGKYSGDVSLEGYREGLKADGALSTLDADAAELNEVDLRRVHDPAVAATIGEQWGVLEDESARLLLRVASLFAESATLPIARLGLLAGLGDEARPGRRSPLRRAVQRLEDACLVERLEADLTRLHPLIREFTASRTPPEEVEGFRRECALRAAGALESFSTLRALYGRRGLDGLQVDLIAILELCPPSPPDLGARLQALLRLLQREAHNLPVRNQGSEPTLFAQQVRNRAFLLGISPLRATAEQTLTSLGHAHFRLLWTASRESRKLVRTLSGHGGWVSSVGVSPDSRRVISGSGDCLLRLWDLRTGQLLGVLGGHRDGVSSVVVSANGRHVLSGSHDRTLRLWDLQTGSLLRTLVGHDDMVFGVAMSPDGCRALSGSRDCTLKLWDLATGRLLRNFTGQEHGVSAVAMSPDGRHALSGSYDGTVILWDVETGQLVRTFAGHDEGVNAVSMSPDGRRAISGSHDHTLRLWDLATGRLVHTLVGHEGLVFGVAISPDGQKALSGSYDRTLRLWDLTTGDVLGTFAGHEWAVSAVAFTPDGRRAVSGSEDRTIKVWDLVAGSPQPIAVGHEGAVSAVAVSRDGQRAVSGSDDRTVKVWDVPTGGLVYSLARHDSEVSSVAISPDGWHALSGSYDRTLRLWDLRAGELLDTCSGYERREGVGAVRVERGSALSSFLKGTLRLWGHGGDPDTQTGRRAIKLSALRVLRRWVLMSSHGQWDNAVAITKDGRCALSGSHDRTLNLWNLRTGELIRSLAGHTDFVHAVALAPDDSHALSGSSDRTMRLWELATGRLLHTFTGHGGRVIAVAFCPDGRYALSGSSDRTLRLWDLEERTCRAMALVDSSPLAIAVASDSRTTAVGDQVGNVHHFRLHVN
jgi:WD40 repeat protein